MIIRINLIINVSLKTHAVAFLKMKIPKQKRNSFNKNFYKKFLKTSNKKKNY